MLETSEFEYNIMFLIDYTININQNTIKLKGKNDIYFHALVNF